MELLKLVDELAEIEAQEKADNAAFAKWLKSDPDYSLISRGGAASLEQFVEALNMEIGDLKSEIVRLKINKG